MVIYLWHNLAGPGRILHNSNNSNRNYIYIFYTGMVTTVEGWREAGMNLCPRPNLAGPGRILHNSNSNSNKKG